MKMQKMKTKQGKVHKDNVQRKTELLYYLFITKLNKYLGAEVHGKTTVRSCFHNYDFNIPYTEKPD